MEQTFRSDSDPYRTAPLAERRKQGVIAALLSDRRYRRALDAGCAEGGFTREMAPLCDRVVALDISETAIWRAMVNLADVSNVSFLRANLREHPVLPGWDLIVLGDVMPHLDAGERWDDELQRLCARLTDSLTPGGRLLMHARLDRPADYSAARRHSRFFMETGAVRPVHEIVGGGVAGEPRFMASLFERPAAAKSAPVAVEASSDARSASFRTSR